MKLAVLQSAPHYGRVAENLEAMRAQLDACDAEVIVLPELFASGYLFDSRAELARRAESLDGPTVTALRQWARDHDAALCGGWPERAENRLYNSAVIVGPDGILAHYRKLHLFDRETLYFDPGDLDLPVIPWRDARLGLMICWDWRYPEVSRTLALRGADILLHPSNLALDLCPPAMITRALENRVFVATADRWGVEESEKLRLEFEGQSQIVDPAGKLLGRLGPGRDGMLCVEIDPAAARDKRANSHNDLWADRRPEMYED